MKELRKSYIVDKGFIHGTVFEFPDGRGVNTAALGRMTKNPNAIPLGFEDGAFFLEFEGERYPCAPLEQPSILYQKTEFGGQWGDFVRKHSRNTIFLTPLRGCTFEMCEFCNFTSNKVEKIDVYKLTDVVEEVAKLVEGDTVEVAIGSGTPHDNDRGVEYFSQIVASVRSKVSKNCGMSVEMVPPPNLDDLQKLKDAGVNSIIMSIEIWNERIRKVICPGKSAVPRLHYIKAWKRAVEVFGPGQVSSVILVGLQPESEVKAAINALVGIGVQPLLIPFRPHNGIKLRDHPVTDYQKFAECTEHNTKAKAKAGLDKRPRGCALCDFCS